MWLLCVVGEVESVTQLLDIIYILPSRSSTVMRFDAVSHQRQTDIDVISMMSPHDIVACQQTSSLYVADFMNVWRLSPDGTNVENWLPDVKPWTLSVTFSRLLVTSPETKQLVQFDASGNELRRVSLQSYIVPRHAVESPSGTFIVSHNNSKLERDEISELDKNGVILRQFCGSPLRWPDRLAVDSRGNVVVADCYNCCILLLSRKLKLRRVIVTEHQLNYKPLRGVWLMEQTGRLLAPSVNSIAVFYIPTG